MRDISVWVISMQVQRISNVTIPELETDGYASVSDSRPEPLSVKGEIQPEEEVRMKRKEIL